ncbi:FtsX-like permease family protein [Streptomyces sp. NPDC050738]|uniref:FtsX-like permease family protein n=1 Tax=Streptomyces sp. NPDC050738 TaxID=3154744 RepID=UPI0034351D78
MKKSPTTAPDPTAGSRGMRRASAFLAIRSLKSHRRSWSAVFVAIAAAGALLGAFAMVIGTLLFAHPPVERLGAADAVVAADQQVKYTAKPWGSEPTTVSAYLPERSRLDTSVLAKVRAADGVAKAIPDNTLALEAGSAGTATGRAWSAAELTPYKLTSGHAPTAPDEVVLDTRLTASAGMPPAGTTPADRRTSSTAPLRPGSTVWLQTDGPARPYKVSGLAETTQPGTPSAFFTDRQLSALTGHPTALDAIGVIAEPGVSTDALYDSVRAALPDHSVRVLTGEGRGLAEHLDSAGARSEQLQLLGSIGGTVLMVALLVIATTISQAVHQRSRELALLRAVGATPRQLRSAVGREVTRVSRFAVCAGIAGAVPLGLFLRSLLTTDALPLPAPAAVLVLAPVAAAALVMAAARPVAALAARKATSARPAEAMRTASAPEASAPGKVRSGLGLVLAVAGFAAAGTATVQGGQAAAAAVSASALTLIIAVALLGPSIARVATRVLGAPLRRMSGPSGYLAASALTGHARRLGAALTPIALVVAFICVQLSSGATIDRASEAQAAASVRADIAVSGPPAGIPASVAEAVRNTPGVTAATGSLHSTVVIAHREAGDPALTRYPVQGVTPGHLTSMLDPDVTAGDLGRLTGPDTVAVGKDRAESLGVEPGDTVELRYGDGTKARLHVVATYERALGVGDFLLPHDQLAVHVTAPRDSRVLVAVDSPKAAAAVQAALSPYTGLHLAPATGADVRPTPEPDQKNMLVIGVGVIGGFTVLAVVSTLALITIGRRRELDLLRLVGAGRRQVARMLALETALITTAGLVIGTVVAAVPLMAFGLTAAGTLPYLPPADYAVIALTVTAAAAAGTLIPAVTRRTGTRGRRTRRPAPRSAH